jgi:integrase
MNEEPILKTTKKGKKVRILRPIEYKQLISAIPKVEYIDKFEALLYSGCRYSEIKRLYKHPQWLKNNSIQLPSYKKSSFNERFVRLNPQGVRAVKYFLKAKKNLPAYSTWDENLVRWAEKANLNPEGICIKTTRKTWESWLVTCYPKSLEQIFLSQGHSQMVALKFYLMLPFTDEEKNQMKEYVMGWI